jgi:nucleoside-diphosphate-sugar epimerase
MVNLLILGRTGYVPFALAQALQKFGHRSYFVSRAQHQNSGDSVFTVTENSTLDSAQLMEYIYQNNIDAVINTSNKFSRTLEISDLESAAVSNFLHPARVLAIAADAGVRTFINLASAWQLDELKRDQHPIYTGTKNALVEFERSFQSKVEIWDVFVAEIFGVGDTRPKLLNLIKQASKSGEILELHSLKTKLHLTSLDRLASHISDLLGQKVNAPKSHLYINFRDIPIHEILRIARAVLPGSLSTRDMDREPELLSLKAPVVGAMKASDLEADLGKFFQFEIL